LTSPVVHVNVRLHRSRFDQFFQMRLGVPRRAGRIGKRVRIPRGRATVKIVAEFMRRCKSQETCPDAVCSFRTPAKRCSGRRGNSLLSKDPVASLSPFAWQKGRRDFVFSALEKKVCERSSQQSAPRTDDNSPAIHRWVSVIIKDRSPRSGRQTLHRSLSVSVARFMGSESNIFPRSQH
jgi:hypothetical protein